MEGLDSIVIFYRKSASAVAAPPLAIFQPVRGDSGPLERLSVLWILYTEGKAPRAAAAPPPGAHFSRPPPLLYDLLRKTPRGFLTALFSPGNPPFEIRGNSRAIA